MIWESWYWKNDLGRRAASLKRRRSQKRWAEASLARLEQEVMLGFYSVRKLLEARKLTDDVAQQQVGVLEYPARPANNVSLMNWDKIEKHYDLDSPRKIAVHLSFVCDQIIHSYVFVPAMDEVTGGLHSICFASDRERSKRVFEIDIENLISVFQIVADDDVTRSQMTWNDERRDYDVKNA